MAKWKCVFAGRWREEGRWGEKEYEDIRLFIKDGDRTRIYGCDNSGRHPGEAELGPTELDLTQPGCLSVEEAEWWEWKKKLPYNVKWPTTDGKWISVPLEGAIWLRDNYGVSFKSEMPNWLTSRVAALHQIIQLTRPDLEQLAGVAQ